MSDEALIFRRIPKFDLGVLERLRGVGVADLHDALPPTARKGVLLAAAIRPLVPGQCIFGPAVTAYCAPGDGLMSHCALFVASPGDVLVLSNGAVPQSAVWGGTMALDARANGVRGVICDAPVRDTAFIRELGHPTWASSVSSHRTEKNGHGYVNMPVKCGGVEVNPGDLIVADDDGVIAIDPALAREAVAGLSASVRKARQLRKRIEGGERLFDAVRFGDRLQELGIEIRDEVWRPTDKPDS